MSTGQTAISVRGKPTFVPSAAIDGRTIISTGRWLKIATVQDEDLIEDDTVSNPDSFVCRLKESGLDADIFTFAQRLSETNPRYKYNNEWDNFAVIPITSFSEWWEKKVESSVRRAVRKAAKLGLVVRQAEFDDDFIKGIVEINNESEIRQGREFWHFQKPFEAVKLENETYPGRNLFLGAYLGEELVGFIRIIHGGKQANIIQILSKMKHYDKRPQNALIAKAVEICEQRGFSNLTYCNYVYNDPDSSLTEFKRRNGFQQIVVPRYYLPLTLKGQIALKFGLHHGAMKLIPRPVYKRLLELRTSWYARKSKTDQETA